MKTSEMQDKILHSIHHLDLWIENNGWAGYDPYDLRQYKLYQILAGIYAPKYLRFFTRRMVEYAEKHHPMAVRKGFQIPKRINAKGMGLFARGYLNLYRMKEDDKYLAKADECLGWLLENSSFSGNPSKLGWGYPFTWYAGHKEQHIFPPNTPFAVVTTVAGHAFLDRFDILREWSDVEHAQKCARFLLEDLNRDEINESELCFSYGPLDNNHVINANLNVATFLSRLSRYIDDDDMLHLARKARKFSVSLQNGDGSWFYWAPPDLKFWSVDNYHMGIKLEWLWMVRQYDPEPEDEENLKKGLRYYITNLFDSDGTPKLTPFDPYPYDIHSASQAIATFALLKKDYPAACRSMLVKIVQWTLKNLSNADGSFAYRIYPGLKDQTPHIRWGQAWMLWALSCAARTLHEDSFVNGDE